jgi:hypothetical protein
MTFRRATRAPARQAAPDLSQAHQHAGGAVDQLRRSDAPGRPAPHREWVSALRVSAAPREPGSVGQLEQQGLPDQLKFTHSIGRRAKRLCHGARRVRRATGPFKESPRTQRAPCSSLSGSARSARVRGRIRVRSLKLLKITHSFPRRPIKEESPRSCPSRGGSPPRLVIAGGLARPRATSGPLLRDAVPAGNRICVVFRRRAPKPRNLDVTSDCTSSRSGSSYRTTSFRQNLREGPDLGTPSGIATRMSQLRAPLAARVSPKFCLLFADITELFADRRTSPTTR